MYLHLFHHALGLWMIFHSVWSDGNVIRQFPLPLWKNLLIHHHRWTGSYVDDNGQFTCSLYVHSVSYDHQGNSLVTFTSEGFHIEMEGFSPDNETVVFKESHTWNKSGEFKNHKDLVFHGEFVSHSLYYKYQANVSSKEAVNFGSVTLIPQGRRSVKITKDDRKGLRLGLAIGIPFFVGSIVLTLAVFLIVWAVRKGYLRHVPWKYRNFNNRESNVEMDGEQPVTVDGVESAAVHI